MTRAQERVYGFICARVDETGALPTVREIGNHFGISVVGAWKHRRSLLEQGRLVRLADGRVVIPGRVDLRPVTTDQLRAELARRERAARRRPQALAA
jgi:SOS-response transcriptional repressor LexA